MKFSFLMSLVAWVVLFVAVAFLYFVLSSLGVFTSIQHTLTSVTSSSGRAGPPETTGSRRHGCWATRCRSAR